MEYGQHCSLSDCNQIDFLPFTCNACEKIYCLDHRSYAAHQCKVGLSRDHQALFCPECSSSLVVGVNGNADEVLSRHLTYDCAGKQANSSAKKKCLVKGCKESLTLTKCKLCHEDVCIPHRFEKDHNCTSLTSPACCVRGCSATLSSKCPTCHQAVCKSHQQSQNHSCHKPKTNEVNSKPKSQQVHCIVKGCKDNNLAGATCKLCRKPVCLTHRFERDHNCDMLREKSPILSNENRPSNGPESLCEMCVIS
jgi:predicted nucleic acid binding AN1-type Zn finger protein